jgi:hypothetical protein
MNSSFRRSVLCLSILAAAAPWARADLVFTAEPLGDKTTSPKFFFAETTGQNVILKVRVQNTESVARQITFLRLSFPGTDMSFLKPQYVHLLPDPDGDGDIRTPPRAHGHNLSLHAAARSASPPRADFHIESGALVFPPNSTTYLFMAYDCNDIQTDRAIINARIDSPGDVSADAAVVFNGEIDSPGVDRVDVVATTYQFDMPASVAAGQEFAVTVKAVDSPGNHDLDANAVVRPGAASQNAAQPSPNGTAPSYPAEQSLSEGRAAFSGIRFFNAASQSRVGIAYVSGHPPQLGGTKNSPIVAVEAGPPLLDFAPIARQTAGVPFAVRVTGGSDAYGNSMVGNTMRFGTFSEDGPQPSPADDKAPGRSPLYSPESHVWTAILQQADFTVTLFKAQKNARLGAQDTARPGAPGFSAPFDVVNNSTAHAHLDLPERAGVDETFLGTVSAHDAYNNPVEGFAGTFHASVEPSSSTDRLPADFGAPAGVTQVPFTFHKWGLKTITVRDDSSPPWLASDTIYIDLPYLHDTIAWPSPYRPREGPLNIRFFADSGGAARVMILNFEGTKVREWNVDSASLGSDEVKRLAWDGRDESGNELASGLYYCVTEAGGKVGRVKFGLIQ